MPGQSLPLELQAVLGRPANNVFLSGRASLNSNNFCEKAVMKVLEFRVLDMIAPFIYGF